MKRVALFIVVMVIVICVVSIALCETGMAAPNTIKYTIKKGDTLYSLAIRFDTKEDIIYKLNPNIQARKLIPGNKISLQPGSNLIIHKVVFGETLTSISKKYNVTINHIAQKNKISNINKISLGEYLSISKFIDIKLYYILSKETEFKLAYESLKIPNKGDIYKTTLEKLISGPKSGKLFLPIPKETKVQKVKIIASIAHVYFSKEIMHGNMGSYTEALTLIALTDTLTEFREIKGVLIYSAGVKIDTLAGHILIEEPLKRDIRQLDRSFISSNANISSINKRDFSLCPKSLAKLSNEEEKQMKKSLLNVHSVRLNSLGLSRIENYSLYRGDKSLFKPTAVPNGMEIDTGDNDTNVETQISESRSSKENYDLPSKVDNSKLKYFPPISVQQYSSCGSFSATYYQLTYTNAFARDWDIKSSGSPNNVFSAKWTYNLLNNGEDKGTWMTWAYELFKNHGAATLSEFPYEGGYLEWPMSQGAWRTALNYRVDEYGQVNNLDSEEGLKKLKQLLNDGYILTFATYISSWHTTNILNQPSITDDDQYEGKNVVTWMDDRNLEGHAMTLVGYDDELWADINGNGIVDLGEKGALRAANSWGSNWEDDGFIWISYDALREKSDMLDKKFTNLEVNNVKINRKAAFWYNSAYWITAKSSYTPKLVAKFTLSSTKRNQIKVSLGYSDAKSNEPLKIRDLYVLNKSGGEYSFDGTNNVCEATFVVDYTNLIDENQLTAKQQYKWYLIIEDLVKDNSKTVIENFRLIDNPWCNFRCSNNYSYDNKYKCNRFDNPMVIDGEKIILNTVDEFE